MKTWKTNRAYRLKTLINITTTKQTFMLLWNPCNIERGDWYQHVNLFGFSFVRFGINTPQYNMAAHYENLDHYNGQFVLRTFSGKAVL